MREQGAKVFHDIPAPTFNLDHVVISTTGIFVIETKTYSKPGDGQGKLHFDGTHITSPNVYRSDQAVNQVRAAATWLRELIKETTGKQFEIKPVIVFPGWYVETSNDAKSPDIWVLNPKGLPTFIGNNRNKLSPEDVSLVAYHLAAYVRNFGGSTL